MHHFGLIELRPVRDTNFVIPRQPPGCPWLIVTTERDNDVAYHVVWAQATGFILCTGEPTAVELRSDLAAVTSGCAGLPVHPFGLSNVPQDLDVLRRLVRGADNFRWGSLGLVLNPLDGVHCSEEYARGTLSAFHADPRTQFARRLNVLACSPDDVFRTVHGGPMSRETAQTCIDYLEGLMTAEQLQMDHGVAATP